MNIGDIAERFIRAAEIERSTPEQIGPAPMRSMSLPYVHDWVDKLGWRKEKGDKLQPGEDPLAEERRLFWERLGLQASSQELSELECLREWLLMVDDEGQRRALLAWSMAKAGGRSFNKWCFKVEGIHPETGRRRKNRALARISAHVAREGVQHCDDGEIGVLLDTPENGHIDANIAGAVTEHKGITAWASDEAFTSYLSDKPADFSWAQKRWERRRQREAKKKQEAA
ncbi:hypothetical protein NA8A_18167 [Nitratireductor indicus C115]|uniref:Uncharacterized protein n=1 Tax=Nitratireductor indicus C115 TaxID=1231190 RepID=K2MZZ3_9HYPH|nr:hypothetical protein [Nitratireductor indicus]EKF40843.1 hypothetical protein NA8A_18167 [Nitratireductor indicus C115]SFQ33944.1 hypothetical protein SAMN05216176_102663 [Nitratireductor indicus]